MGTCPLALRHIPMSIFIDFGMIGSDFRFHYHSCAFQSVDTYGKRCLECDYSDKITFVDCRLGVQEFHIVEIGDGVTLFLRALVSMVKYATPNDVRFWKK